MITVSELSRAELRRRLTSSGIALRTGCFITRLHSPIPRVADAIHLLYADYPLAEGDRFADFHVRVAPSQGLRRWYKPQAKFYLDGDSLFNPLPLSHAYPMLEWGLNWCVSTRAHNYLILHAAVVERNGLAAILPAPPGSGKSTLCAALVSSGWRLLSDELTMIRPADGMLVPLPRPISLKNASIDVMRQFHPAAVISQPVANTTKGTVAHVKPPADSIRRAGEVARPAWIVFPKYAAGAATTLEPIAQARAFMRVAENGFNYSVLAGTGFDTMAGLIGRTRSYAFTYSDLHEAIDAFSRLEPPPP